MIDNQDTSPKTTDHRIDAAISSIWVLFLGAIAVIELGSLLISRSMLAAVLH